MTVEHSHDEAHRVFWSEADVDAREEVSRLLTLDECELSPDFLGFLGTYRHLAAIIPTDRMIYDVGCYMAIQAWFFRRHRGYVGIDPAVPVSDRFRAPNVTHIRGTLHDVGQIDPCHFGISNYVPNLGSGRMATVFDHF